MATFKVVYPDGSLAKRTKVSISFKGGGMSNGYTDDRGVVSISGSSTYGKVYVSGKLVYDGSLNVSEVPAK